MKSKKGLELSMNAIVIAALALLVLLVLVYFYGNSLVKGFGVFDTIGDKTQKELTQAPLFGGYCTTAPADEKAVGGTCADECDVGKQYRTPLRGWYDCDAVAPLCCKG